MRHISIIIPRGHTSLVNIEGAHQIFSNVNEILIDLGKDPLFDVQLVGLSKVTKQSTGLFSVNPHLLIDDVENTDLIIIPAIHGNQYKAAERNREFIPWILDQYEKGAEVASFCLGSFFLAATGLLNGKRATTHWRFSAEFTRMYPDVILLDDKIMTEEKGIYTSGGAYSYLNLILYLIEKYAGREIAVMTAKSFMIDLDKYSQSPFIMFRGQKDHNDEVIKKAQEFIENNFQKKITVEELASIFALSRRNLERRFKKATSNTISEYIKRVKIEAAKLSLESSRESVTDAMYKVGYSDPKAFRNTFKKITGLTPYEYRNKYNQLMVAS
jgi:transcriptional regulator GlxA family with amidase domain